MRGRRNTHRSTLSTSSSSSADSAATAPARNSLSEKDVERQLDDESLVDELSKPKRSRYLSGRRISHVLTSYRRATAICIALFLAFSVLRTVIIQHNLSRQATFSTDKPPTYGTYQLTDKTGKTRWTVAIPSNSTFPLSSSSYGRICRDASRLNTPPTSSFSHIWRPIATGIAHDHTYIDTDEAQALGSLPGDALTGDTCESSLTLVIDHNEASFGKTLMLLWLSYGLARQQGKAFFLDDSHWAYGVYSSYFPPLPRPACSRPPASHIVPCPLQARHVVITASTASTALQQAFSPLNQNAMYDLARTGYEASFRLVGEDASYAQDRVKELREKAVGNQQPLIGMHVRRGDLHPFELEYSQDYLPLERFTDVAKQMLKSNTPTTLALSSDDPDIIESTELTMVAAPHTLARTQERIQLASKLALDRTAPAKPIREPGSPYTKHMDENAGWDGGFYTALFHSIGDQRKRSEQHLLAAPPSKDALRMKELIGRGYLLDLALLSQMDGVVCASSSAACRLLGVMMGREALQTKRWVNVDDGRSWSWDGSR